jgi:hypothetical protein
MRYESFPIPVKSSDTGIEASCLVDRFTNKTIQVSGNFAGGWVVQLEGTVGESGVWVSVGAAYAAAALVEVTPAYKKFRCNTTTKGTGLPPLVTFAGQDLRAGE